MLAEKVVSLRENTLYEEIESFFNELEGQSKSTRIAYETDIRQFFKTVKNRDIEHLVLDDLKIKKKDMINYRKHLIDNFELANSTINNKITAVKSLYLYLSDDFEVNMNSFNFKSLKVHHNSYGSLSQTEAERFAETAFLTEKHKSYMKKMLIIFAIRTSFRLNEILNVKWQDFEEFENGYKVTTLIGKGQKENTKAISKKLYEQIYELKELNKSNEWNGNPDIVFQTNKDSVTDMMVRLRKKLKIDESRNVKFHSFRGVAIDWELETTGDIRKAAQQANHSNINTTYKHYINKKMDYSLAAGIRMEEEINLSFLDEMDIEDFKKFIKQGNYKLQLDIKNFAEKLNKNNSNDLEN